MREMKENLFQFCSKYIQNLEKYAKRDKKKIEVKQR